MAGWGEPGVILCVVPRELERKLAGALTKFFDGTDVEVVVERRRGERREQCERRERPLPRERIIERRRVRAEAGRRVAERRWASVPAPTPELPRRARGHASKLAFVTRLEPAPVLLRDVDEARLVVRAQAGDEEALRTLYMGSFDLVYVYARGVLRDGRAAEEIAADTLAHALSRLDDLDPLTIAYRAFLFAHALNILEPPPLFDRPELAEGAVDVLVPEAMRWVSDVELELLVGRLPRPARDVLLLRYLAGLGSAQIADLLDIDLAEERAVHNAALTRLRDTLNQLGRSAPSRERQAMRRTSHTSAVLRQRRLALQTG